MRWIRRTKKRMQAAFEAQTNRLIDWLTEEFGDLPFILFFNIMTAVWFVLGVTMPWFPDKYPFNFFTFLVSWGAINMTSFVLWRDRRRKEVEDELKRHQDQQDQRQYQMTEALIRYGDGHQRLLGYLADQATAQDADMSRVADAVESMARLLGTTLDTLERARDVEKIRKELDE